MMIPNAIDTDNRDATALEETMEDKRSTTWEREDFPPWSVKTLIIWVVGFLALSSIIFLIGGVVAAHANLSLGLGLNTEELISIGRLPSEAAYVGTIFIFITFRLRKQSFSLRDVWGSRSYTVEPGYTGIGFLLGVSFMSLWSLAIWFIRGHLGTPPRFPAWIDYRLVLCTQLLVNAFMIGILEEIFYRGLLYRVLRRRISIERAMVLSALIFTAYHLEYITDFVHVVFIFLFGIMAAVLFERTQSLNTCISLHISTNATASTISYLVHLGILQ